MVSSCFSLGPPVMEGHFKSALPHDAVAETAISRIQALHMFLSL